MLRQPGSSDEASNDAAPQLLKLRGAVPRLVWTASDDGRLLYMNTDLQRLLGNCKGGVVEELMQEKLLHADDRPRWLTAWRRAIASGQSYEVEYRVRPGADGAVHWYVERGAQCECRGRNDRWFVTATQIDAQKYREEELRRSLQLKDEFFATLLHELRNPLAPIANAIEALAARPYDPCIARRACGVMQRQLRQLTLLVDDLLDMSRVTRGAVTLHRDWIDLTEVIAASVETARPIMEARAHRLTTTQPRTPALIYADAIRLRQVISNLLINAAKYTDRGGDIHIELELAAREVAIWVRDNGIGISRESLPRIFEPFTQAAPGSRSAMGGMGVGLAVARELVQLHGGAICAHSDGPGCGSEFVIRLPRHASAAGAGEFATSATFGA